MRFDDFKIGDYVTFQRHFTSSDYRVFQRISGDSNPLHHDAAYGAISEFGRTIVPLHLVASPLSAVAGMSLPGEPSLYLGHELRAIAPVYFGDRLTYSARVCSINHSHRVLTLSVVVLRGIDVVLEGEMRVQSRLEDWSTKSEYVSAGRPSALVTGATGAIGTAISLALARKGWRLWLHARHESTSAMALASECNALGGEAKVVSANLEHSADRARLSRSLRGEEAPNTLIYAACPALDSGLNRLVAVNYESLKELSEAMLPGMLYRQEGAVLLIGSTALGNFPAGWENYVAAKAMAVAYVSGIAKRYGNFGLRGMVLAPGYVRTPFSAAWRKDAIGSLLPEEVAETALNMLTSPATPGKMYTWLEPGLVASGTWGFRPADSSIQPTAVTQGIGNQFPARSTTGSDEFSDTVKRLLKLPSNTLMAGTGIGKIDGWDSLRHIELIIGIERVYGISFTSGEIDQTREFDGLLSLWQRKTAL
jgi:short-subunit dehydrogenase/acyl dehydratase/acyl carrier protein